MQQNGTFFHHQNSPGEPLAPYDEHYTHLDHLCSHDRSAGRENLLHGGVWLHGCSRYHRRGQRWVELALHEKAPTFTLVTWFPQMPPGSIQGLVLDTDNIAQAYEELKARGVEVLPNESDPWGQFARFNDPDGNGLVLRQLSSAH